MRTGIIIDVSPSDRCRLEALVRNRNTPQKHAWRAQIVLLSAAGSGTNEIMRLSGKSKTCVWRWQDRFAEAGVEGLLRDKTRPSRSPPLADEIAERVVALTLTDPPASTALLVLSSVVSIPAYGTLFQNPIVANLVDRIKQIEPCLPLPRGGCRHSSRVPAGLFRMIFTIRGGDCLKNVGY